jgi:CHAT domain-containing protein
LDIKGEPHAADPNGEHWACVVRQRGEPIWVKLPGTGPDGGWTKDDDELPSEAANAFAARPSDSSASWRELRDRLYRQRLEPIERHLGPGPDMPAIKHLIILPSSAMAQVPVAALAERYVVTYAPSGTLFAWLQSERKKRPETDDGLAGSLLALGDPAFPTADDPTATETPPPDHGVLVTMVTRGSNAARAGVKSGDVLLNYAGTKLSDLKVLTLAIQKNAPKSPPNSPEPPAERSGTEAKRIPVQVWRDGETLDLAVQPGKLGVALSQQPAAEAILARREADKAIRASRGGSFAPLPGTRTEVEAIAKLFDHPQRLLGSDASEQNLQELATSGRLRQFRYLHLATHGDLDTDVPMHTAVILAQDLNVDQAEQYLAGKPVYDGRLTAEQILQTWDLDAELVTLSACQTALGKQSGGEGYLGFSQALFLAGARSLVLSLWKVDDQATALLMTRLYQNLLGKREGLNGPMPKSAALHEARNWLRSLPAEQADALIAKLPPDERGQVRERKPTAAPASAHPFEHPYFWAAFILIGDPN